MVAQAAVTYWPPRLPRSMTLSPDRMAAGSAVLFFWRRKTHLKHASNERRWNAVARDVRHKNRQSIVGGRKEVIEVPSHECHRLVPRRKPEAVKRRRRLRDDRA